MRHNARRPSETLRDVPNSRSVTPPATLAPDRRSARALDLRRFTPAAITLLAQKINASASAEYRPRFGVGVTDWRIIAQLGAEPWIAPVRIAELTGLDKAAVSRSLASLRALGLATGSDEAPPRRRSLFALTPEGLALHDRIAQAALERERRLLRDFSVEERARFQEFVERMLAAVEKT